MEFFRYDLPNEIRCVLKRIKSPVTYCAITVNSGSRDELSDEIGMAHFMEHMLFKGTSKRKAHHINSRLEKLGGELNAFTTKEETVIHATTLKRDFAKAAELIADIAFNSTFPQKEIDKEKEVIIDEINSYKDSPADRIYDEFEDMLFAGSDLGHNILGSKRTIQKFDTGKIESFSGRCYNTDQMVLSVAGNITENNFVKVADAFFKNCASNPRNFKRQAPSEIDKFYKSVDRHTHQCHCIVGKRAYNYKDPKRVDLALLVNLLGGPAANSLLNSELREKNGLTYNIEASYTPYFDTGISSIYFGTDTDKAEQCLELIERQFRLLRENELSSYRLNMAKRQFLGQLAISMEAREGYMLGAAKSLILFNDIDSQQALYKKIEEITPQSILEVANEIYNDNSILIYR